MFGLNFFDIHILQENKRKTNSVKTTQDVIDGASAAVADGQFSRGIQASIFPRRQKSRNFLDEWYCLLATTAKSVGISVRCSGQLG